ncbi:MAG: ABC transporter permease [Hespellia sp.]|nr:ABC transporter permease [Hespellia sp.]
MTEKTVTSHQDISVIKMLARTFARYNKGRNRILLGAVVLCIVTLTMVFGISYGKVQAEYTKAVRAAGTTGATVIEDADQSQYETVSTLGYVKELGRRVEAGQAEASGKMVCEMQWLDENAWENMTKPAYTNIHGTYPAQPQELMLSVRALKSLGVTKPAEGQQIELTVYIGLFRTEQETFELCGWFTDYVDEASNSAIGYISKEKLEDWGYQIEESADLLICQSETMNWQETEERLYKDVQMKDSGQTISASNPFAYDAVNQIVGSYEMAVFGALVILCGMFFLIYNVMQISMVGDIRQMGLFNIIGTTKKQIRSIYYRQMHSILLRGVLLGSVLSAIILRVVIPNILGNQYLSGYGGAKELQIFRPEILLISVLCAALMTMSVAAGVIHHLVNVSAVESIHYTGLEKKKRRKTKKGNVHKRNAHKKSATGELWYMAWRNLIRHRTRFLLTVFSLFMGVMAFLGVVVITSGSDYANVIETRPDYLIAGQFSAWGQELGYGNEYKVRDPGEDPLKTAGDYFSLLYANDYEEFSPISEDVKEQLLAIPGVDKDKSYVMEGAYVDMTISQKGIRPFVDESEMPAEDTAMLEGFHSDVVQILNENEIQNLKDYVEKNQLSVDMETLENGTGVMLLHDHQLSPQQERQAEESVGESVYFTSLLPREAEMMWNADEEKRNSGTLTGAQSDTFTLSGYLDNQAEGFPKIRQTWHGGEGNLYFLISEKGFEKIPTSKKTLYMELSVDEDKDAQIKSAVQKIVSQENQKRAQTIGTSADGESTEAGIFYISKSDLMLEASGYIRGNRLILGSISIVLLFAGLTNYFNVMVTGILSRKKELDVMHCIGMTKKQERKLLLMEGGYYCLIVALLMLTVGSAILKLIAVYMENKLSYFVYHYPAGWSVALIGGLLAVCLLVPWMMCRQKVDVTCE